MATLLQYKCPCCGGEIKFDSSTQQMKCPYCDTTFDVNSLKDHDAAIHNQQTEDNLNWQNSAGSQWQDGETDDMLLYVCNSCGGQIIGSRTTAATSCPFCGSPVIVTQQFTGDLKPDYVIPFKLNKNDAKEALKRHLKGKRFIPKVFKQEQHIDEIKGIYVPFWLFDADANAQIRYKATRTRSWSDRLYHYTETSFYSVIREGSIGFKCVPVDGSLKMADDLMESIEPYNYAEAVDFQTAYLSGYLADRYDVTAQESVGRANDRIKRSTETTFSSTVHGYHTVMPESSNIQFLNGSVKYALLPVWILNTTWKEQRYTFAMNGQTGKFVGNLPMRKGLYRFWYIMLTFLFSALAMGILSNVLNLSW